MNKSFIIIEPDPIVAMDVQGLLSSQFPRADITTGESLADIGPVIHNCGPASMLVVKGTLLADDGNLRRVVKTAAVRRARVFVIGGPFDLDFPVTFIELPFTSDTMLAAMTQDAPDPDLGSTPAL